MSLGMARLLLSYTRNMLSAAPHPLPGQRRKVRSASYRQYGGPCSDTYAVRSRLYTVYEKNLYCTRLKLKPESSDRKSAFVSRRGSGCVGRKLSKRTQVSRKVLGL